MHFSAVTFFTILSLISLVSGHARIRKPKPLDAPVETPDGNAYNAPLAADGSEFPCRGLHKKSGVDKSPVETWQAGSKAAFEILGHVTSGEGALAAHSGGSCQASLSFDDGVTWKAIHTYHGGCPRDVELNSNLAGPNQTFSFDVPAETKAGTVLFAWTWIAATGNRDEFYMNCASVEISGDGYSTLDDFPDMFVGDMNIAGQISTGECRSQYGHNVEYPNPGEFVTTANTPNIPFGAPSDGNCVAPGSSAEEPGDGEGASSSVEAPVATSSSAAGPGATYSSTSSSAAGPDATYATGATSSSAAGPEATYTSDATSSPAVESDFTYPSTEPEATSTYGDGPATPRTTGGGSEQPVLKMTMDGVSYSCRRD